MWSNITQFSTYSSIIEYSTYRAGLRHVGAPDRLIIWCFFILILWNFVGLGQGWQTFLRAIAQIVDDFRRNSFTCGNLIFLTHFQLFQWVCCPGSYPAGLPLSPAWHQITYVAYVWKLFIQGILLQMTHLPHFQNKNHNNDCNNTLVESNVKEKLVLIVRQGCLHQAQWKHLFISNMFVPHTGLHHVIVEKLLNILLNKCTGYINWKKSYNCSED